jgi:hypothetical protein
MPSSIAYRRTVPSNLQVIKMLFRPLSYAAPRAVHVPAASVLIVVTNCAAANVASIANIVSATDDDDMLGL